MRKVIFIVTGLLIIFSLSSSFNSAKAIKDNKEIIQSNPERPYFDQYGNEFSYDGKLLKIAKICIDDNPYCEPKPIKIVIVPEFQGK